MLIDGGDNQLFARYLASRYRGTTPRTAEGDRLHRGVARRRRPLRRSDQDSRVRDDTPTKFKRLFIHPKRVYHNGLVKRPVERTARE